MLTAAFAAGFLDLCVAIAAVEFLSIIDPRPGAGTAASAPPPLLDGMAGLLLLLPLAAAGALYASAAEIHRHLRHATAGTRRLWRRFAVLCTAAGTLHLFFFVLRPAGGVGDAIAGAQARALGLAAARALPAAAVACFFLGVVLIILAHIRAGGEGGGGGASGGVPDGRIWFLTKVAFGAAAAVVWLMGMSSLYAVTTNSKY